MLIAYYLINRSMSESLGLRTPYRMIFQQKSSYDHIPVFESLCYVHNKLRPKDKFAS